MTWEYEDIKDAFTANVNVDPDNRYDKEPEEADDLDTSKDVVSPLTGANEWEALFHYLDNAIRDVIRPELIRREMTISATGQTGWTGENVLNLSFFNVNDDSVYTNPAVGQVEVPNDGDYEIACSAQMVSRGGDSSGYIVVEKSTDGGSSWSEITPFRQYRDELLEDKPESIGIPVHYVHLEEEDRVRVVASRDGGSGDSWDLNGGWLAMSF